jgi:membrane protease YdiL (CAAX protease family)
MQAEVPPAKGSLDSGDPSRPYLQVFLGSWHRWWRPWAGMALFTLLSVAATIALLFGPVIAGVLDDDALASELDDPAVFGLLNLTLAALIPASLFTAWAVHRVRPGFVSSVVGRLRWGWLLAFHAIAFVVVIVSFALSSFIPVDEPSAAADIGGDLVPWATFAPLALVILLTTPLQAAGEEYAFRGYLAQAIGAWARRWTWVPVLVTSFLFALAHGPQDPALFVDRFLFGLVAAVLTIRTGGLEAAIALHVMNNVVVMLVSAAFGDLGRTLEAQNAPWSIVLVDGVQLGLFLAVVLVLTRGRMATSTDRPTSVGRRATPLPQVSAVDPTWAPPTGVKGPESTG